MWGQASDMILVHTLFAAHTSILGWTLTVPGGDKIFRDRTFLVTFIQRTLSIQGLTRSSIQTMIEFAHRKI